MAVSAASSDPGRWPHLIARLLPFALALGALLTLLDSWKIGPPPILGLGPRPTRWDNPLSAASGVQSALVLVSLAATSRHGRRPCPICASRFPLNPQETAERRRRQLRAVHAVPTTRRGLLGLVAVMSAPLWMPSGWPANVVNSLELAAAAVFVVASNTHAALSPWCPWCRGDGGDDENAPEPDPERGRPLNV